MAKNKKGEFPPLQTLYPNINSERNLTWQSPKTELRK
jgi:hypothetical protein